MRLSVFTIVDSYPEGTAAGRNRYSEVVQLAERADEAGLSALWVAEHHFHPGGVCPVPSVLLAAAGAKTRRLRLGVMVSVLPFHNPVELAEQFSLLDQVTNGRLNLGVGSGYIPLEFEGFGVDPNTKRERFDRSLDTLVAALRGSEVQVDAEKGRPVRLNVLPQQTPHPPLWIAVQRREAIPFVARRGVNLALVPYATVGSPEELGDEINDFRAHLPAGVRAEVSVALHVYAGSHPDRARAAFQRFLDSRLATQSTFYQEKVKRDPRHGSAEEIERSGLAVIGSPREVMESLERFRRLGVDEVLGIVDFGGLARADVAESVRTLGEVAGRLGPAADPAPMTAGSEVE